MLKFSSINSEHLVASYSPSMFNNLVLSLIILNNQYISEMHSPIRKLSFLLFLFENIWRWNWMRKCTISLHSTTITLINIIVKFWLLCENLGKKQIGHELEEEIKQLIYCWKKIGGSSLLLSSLGILSKNKFKLKIIKFSLKYYKYRSLHKMKKKLSDCIYMFLYPKYFWGM